MNERARYPLAKAVPRRLLDEQVDALEQAAGRSFILALPAYVRLGGPGFIGAAVTLGAGTLTASMLAGAEFAYRTLWIYWVAAGSGMFMMAAMARFTCRGGFRVIPEQSRRHGWFLARVLTAFVGMVCVAVVFNFGQVALGTHLLESLAGVSGTQFPQSWNWPFYIAVTSWLALRYGRGGAWGTTLFETFMKLALGLMIVCFTACLFIVGIDWPAALRGLVVPWLPSGMAGMDLFIATSAAAIGVSDWVLFHYAGHAKGWGPKHEGLARVDLIAGYFVPFVVVNWLVVCVFAGTLFGAGALPTTAMELSRSLVPLLGETGARYAFFIGFLAVPITSTVGLCLICAIALHEMFGWEPDVRSLRWKICLLLPQIGLLAAWYPSPVTLIILIAAFLSLTNNIVGWSFFLMLNDPDVMGENRGKSYWWNVGILVQITLLNAVAITYVFNRLGFWGD